MKQLSGGGGNRVREAVVDTNRNKKSIHLLEEFVRGLERVNIFQGSRVFFTRNLSFFTSETSFHLKM